MWYKCQIRKRKKTKTSTTIIVTCLRQPSTRWTCYAGRMPGFGLWWQATVQRWGHFGAIVVLPDARSLSGSLRPNKKAREVVLCVRLQGSA